MKNAKLNAEHYANRKWPLALCWSWSCVSVGAGVVFFDSTSLWRLALTLDIGPAAIILYFGRRSGRGIITR